MAGREDTQRDPYDMPVRPSMVDVLTILERRVKLAIRTSTPATVVAFDPITSTVTVLVGNLTVVRVPDPSRPPLKFVALNPRRQEATLAPTTLTLIPVEFPDGSGGGMTFPILPGDTGMLTITDRSLSTWLLKGVPTDPVMAWTHALHDCVFRPGLRAKTTARSPVDMTATVVEGTALVKIGGGAVDFVALATKVLTELTAIKTAFDMHTHAYVPGNLAPAATASPLNPLPVPGSVAAVKAQAE